MGRHVDGHAVDADREIRAVIEVEAAQEILVGFTLAGMLGDDQARHDFQRFADAQERDGVHLLAREADGAGGSRLKGCGLVGGIARRDAAGAGGSRLGRPDGGAATRPGRLSRF